MWRVCWSINRSHDRLTRGVFGGVLFQLVVCFIMKGTDFSQIIFNIKKYTSCIISNTTHFQHKFTARHSVARINIFTVCFISMTTHTIHNNCTFYIYLFNNSLVECGSLHYQGVWPISTHQTGPLVLVPSGAHRYYGFFMDYCICRFHFNVIFMLCCTNQQVSVQCTCTVYVDVI